MSPHSQYRPGKGPAWAEVYMGWTYSASSFYIVSVRTQPVVSIGRPDDTTLMAESEEELKSLLVRMKEKSEKLA